MLATGKNVNVLVLDTEVYSNTGGQASKSTMLSAVAQFASAGKRTGKKDLGLMFMSYGYVYVASVAMGANMNQVVKAFLEAEAYPGPSIIIAYSPCIMHGIDMGFSSEEAKKAVQAGYWPLYRYNPALGAEGKNPFIYESKDPTLGMQDFLAKEIRFATLKLQFPACRRPPVRAGRGLQEGQARLLQETERIEIGPPESGARGAPWPSRFSRSTWSIPTGACCSTRRASWRTAA